MGAWIDNSRLLQPIVQDANAPPVKRRRTPRMFYWAITFVFIAACVLGFGGAFPHGVAPVLFIAFLLAAIITFIAGLYSGR